MHPAHTPTQFNQRTGPGAPTPGSDRPAASRPITMAHGFNTGDRSTSSSRLMSQNTPLSQPRWRGDGTMSHDASGFVSTPVSNRIQAPPSMTTTFTPSLYAPGHNPHQTPSQHTSTPTRNSIIYDQTPQSRPALKRPLTTPESGSAQHSGQKFPSATAQGPKSAAIQNPSQSAQQVKPEDHPAEQVQRGFPVPTKRKYDEFLMSEKVKEISPDFYKVHEKMKQVDKDLEKKIFNRRIDMEEWIRRSPKIKQTLRLAISCHWNTNPIPGEESSCKIKVCGFLVDEKGERIPGQPGRFTNYITYVMVQTIPTLPTEQPGQPFKWSKPQNHLEMELDGVEITRKSNKDIHLGIQVGLEVSQPRYVLKEPLSKLLNLKVEPLSKIRMTLWEYIKAHQLQDPEDRKVVHSNQELKEIFKEDKIHFSSISHRLAQYLQLADVVNLKYQARLGSSAKENERIYDVQVEVDSKLQEGVKTYLKATSRYRDELSALDNNIAEAINRINERVKKRDFMVAYYQSPADFLRRVFESQNKDYQVLKDQFGPSNEELRRSSFYQQSWTREATSRYLDYIQSTARTEKEKEKPNAAK